MSKTVSGIVTWLKDWFVENTDARLTDNRNFKTTRLSPTSSSPLDLNSFTDNGFYYVLGNATNVPYVSNLPSDWGNNSFYLLVEDTDNATYKKQTITDYGARRVCVRARWGAGWTDWKELMFGNWVEYKTVTNANNTFKYKVEYNQAFAKLTYWTTDTQSQSTSWSDYGTPLLSDSWIRPSQPVVLIEKTGDVLIRVNSNSAYLSHRSNTGSSFTANGINVEGIWAYKGNEIPDIYIINDSGNNDNSSTLFGDSLSLRNSGANSTGYNSDGYYTITNTGNQKESMRVLNQLTGITDDFVLEYDSYIQGTNGSSGFVIYNSSTSWEKLTDDGDSSKRTWYGYNNGSFHETGYNGNIVTNKKWVHYKYTCQTNKFSIEISYNGSLVWEHTETIHLTRNANTKYGLDSEWNSNTVTRYKNIKAYKI